MTALAQDRANHEEAWKKHFFPLAQGYKAYKNAIACIDLTTGNVRPGVASPTMLRIGVFAEQKDNTSGTGPVNVNVDLDREIVVRYFDNDTAPNAVTAAMRGQPCYVKDDHTVTAAEAGNSPAGTVADVSALGVGVTFGLGAAGGASGTPSPDESPDAAVNIADGNLTITVAQGGWRFVPAATLTTNRSITLSATGAVAGDQIEVTRDDATANTLAFINGGPGAGTLVTMPASKVNFAVFQFNGTDWVLRRIGAQ